jgi:hypothetical protein
LIKQLEDEQQSLSHIVYPPSKMPIACEAIILLYTHCLLTVLPSYFIKEGRVFESGTHDELTAKRGAYYEYTQLQQLSKAD